MIGDVICFRIRSLQIVSGMIGDVISFRIRSLSYCGCMNEDIMNTDAHVSGFCNEYFLH